MKDADPGAWTPIDTVAVTVLLAMAALLAWRTDAIGPTVDEPLHLVRGLAWWWTDSTRLSFAHPPLANILQAAPAGFVEPIDLTSFRGWDDSNHAMIATQLVEAHYDVFRPLLMAGRRVTSALGVGLALAVYAWTSWRFGRRIGLAALLMVAFNPTILAHAQLVTTDLPVTLAIFVVTAAFVEYLRADATNRLAGAMSLAAFAVAVAVALCTKFTALALVPLFAITGAVWAIRGWGRFAEPRPWRRFGRLGLEMATVAGVSLVGIAAVYRFEDVGLTMAEVLAHPEPQLWLTRRFDHGLLEQRPLWSSLPDGLVMPVPYTWLFGIEMVRHHAATGHETWFAGMRYSLGHPAYFPVMLLIKTPWVVWLGFGLAGAGLVRERRWPTGPTAVVLLVTGALLLLLMRSNLNIGVRHALPLVPLISVVAASALVPWLEGVWARWGRGGQLVVGSLLLSLPVVAVAEAGTYLSWFNIGSAGYAFSIVGEDWGQDSVRLAALVKNEGLDDVVYFPNGLSAAAEVRHRGAEVTVGSCFRRPVPGGAWLVMHAANAKRRLRCVQRLVGERDPDRIVGSHLWLWRTPERAIRAP